MSEFKSMIEVGFDRGEADFRINVSVADLSVEKMNELRAMIPVAIGTAEDMFRREIERRNPAAQKN